MSDSKLNKAYEAIETAEAALKLAKQMLGEVGEITLSKSVSRSYAAKAATVGKSA